MTAESDVDCRTPVPDEFATALVGTVAALELSDGRTSPLHPDRWRDRACGADRWLLDRCHGPTVDLGCGPGRLVEALLARGLSALGVDKSDQAITQCGDRGVPVRRADIFTALPAEGRWDHALLADGNIGIGGDPVALLRRAGTLIRAGGTILVETTPTPTGLWRGAARVTPRGPWFPWAEVGTDAIATVATRAGLRVTEHGTTTNRCFARLGRSHAH
ncbi:class I SAM-dependent methyltransferase [Actinokineospora cianjurensis]|uniref:Methionine biosynthesis protein MetW n=1 Tax=Actinokineospora cianjurensis TaxID=585224 RepID=A0A421AYY5_9PSEU|nr:methyltransferase domain-containing protein [Actinokineospora cianjurensis]RLK55015.1 methionine biosynthesis protein MetW [Actinokineospora cianjurensis]